MNQHRLSHLIAAALLASLAVVGCKKQETPVAPTPTITTPTPPPAAAPLAASAAITGVELGTAVGADMKITSPSTSFAPTDTIIASVATATADPGAAVNGTLNARWTYGGDNQLVNEERKDIVLNGAGVTTFEISKPDGWPTGNYRFEVRLDDGVAQTREFQVR